MNNVKKPIVIYTEIVDALKAILKCAETNGYLDDYSFLNLQYNMPEMSSLHAKEEQALIQAIQSLEKTIDGADKVIRENLQNTLDEMKDSVILTVPTRYKKNEEYRKLAAQQEFVATLQEMSLPLEVLSDIPNIDSISLDKSIEPLEDIDLEDILENQNNDIYYSRVKLGNKKTAFAVTDEQYQSLKQNDDDIIFELPKEPLSNALEDDYCLMDDPIASFELDEEFSQPVSIPREEINHKEVAKETQRTVTPDEKRKSSLNRIQLIKKALEKSQEKGNEQLTQILEHQLEKEIENLQL